MKKRTGGSGWFSLPSWLSGKSETPVASATPAAVNTGASAKPANSVAVNTGAANPANIQAVPGQVNKQGGAIKGGKRKTRRRRKSKRR